MVGHAGLEDGLGGGFVGVVEFCLPDGISWSMAAGEERWESWEDEEHAQSLGEETSVLVRLENLWKGGKNTGTRLYYIDIFSNTRNRSAT